MITKRTKNQIELFDERQKTIGFFTIYLKVEYIMINESSVTYSGYYFFINNEEVKILSKFKNNLDLEKIFNIEMILQPLDSQHLINVLKQRMSEFTYLQLQQEEGENFRTTVEDWEDVP